MHPLKPGKKSNREEPAKKRFQKIATALELRQLQKKSNMKAKAEEQLVPEKVTTALEPPESLKRSSMKAKAVKQPR